MTVIPFNRVIFTMKKVLLCSCLLAIANMSWASCEQLKTQIAKKIIHNGVAKEDFSLEIMANDQAEQTAGQVVGHCQNDHYKIVYYRYHPHHSLK